VQYLYTLAYEAEEMECAEAEAWALLGTEARGRKMMATEACVDVTRAAHVGMCVRQMAGAESFDALLPRVEALGCDAEGFRIVVLKHGRAKADGPGSNDIARRLADVISGRPDLRAPRVLLACFGGDDGWHFGRVESQADRRWVKHTAKPHAYSNSLPTRLARAMVNLVASPGDTIVDPFCGAGTIPIEAASAGIAAVGFDANKKVASHARANLLHFGLPPLVAAGDARHLGGRYDAIVTDLPYGWTSRPKPELYGEVLANLLRLAPRLSIVLGRDAGAEITASGWTILRHARQPKGQLCRHVYVCEAGGPEATGACDANHGDGSDQQQ
jgi:tRNA G10  N-methylase Trm11